ncbi:hypothetical protein, partial [Antrihabitans spumae]
NHTDLTGTLSRSHQRFHVRKYATGTPQPSITVGISKTHGTIAVIKNPADYAWAHASFTSKPVGVVDLASRKINEWAIALITIEEHSSVALHPADSNLFEAACDEVRETRSITAAKLRMRPSGIGATFWYECETRLIPVNDGVRWGLLEITTPCASTAGPIARAGT